MRNKYGAQRAEFDGRSFASQLERGVYMLLKAMEQHGEIRDIECQLTVYLTDAEIKYMPDFKFLDVKSGETQFAEAKGFCTPAWNIKKRLWEYYGPGVLKIFSGTAMRPVLTETIVPKTRGKHVV